MRYCKQKDLYSCGPVAILNALKWGGAKATYSKHINFLAQECRTSKDGTEDKHFDRALRRNGKKWFTVLKPKYFDLQLITDHLYSDGAIIIAHLELNPPHDWHYSFWFGANNIGEETLYLGANAEYGFTRSLIDPDVMTRLLTDTDEDDDPAVWLLYRN